MECSVRLPPLSAGELEARLVREAGVPPSRRDAIEALLDSVEELLSSEEPVVVFILGEWGEGKTAAWYAYVKPALLERGVKVFEVRAGTLWEAVERASWIASPAWRLLAALEAVVRGGGVAGDYQRAVRRLLGGERAVVFIDEVEDLVYRRGGIEQLLEAIHAIIDGEVGLRIGFYLAVSPTAYARIAAWSAWRRLRRRIRLVELKPLRRSEVVQALKAMLDYSCGGCMPVSDPRLLNAVVAASKGNLGALAAYLRRVLAAWSRRGCRPLGADDVARILSEPIPAGLAAGGVDPERLREVGEAGLLVLSDEPGGGLVEARICEYKGGVGDNVWFWRDGSIVVVDGGWRSEAEKLGWRLLECKGEGRKAYVLKPSILAGVYAESGGIASFILDPGVRLEALRAAYRNPRLAVRGLASLLCISLGCGSCRAGDGYAVLELRLNSLRLRLAILGEGGAASVSAVAGYKPHAAICLGGCEGVPWRSVKLEVDPVWLLKLGALGYVSRENCKPGGVDRDALLAMASRLTVDYGLVDKMLEALRRPYPLIVPRFRLPPGVGPEALRCVLHMLSLLVEAPEESVAEKASRLCRLSGHAARVALRALVSNGVVAEKDGAARVALSDVERGILEVLKGLGGVARLEELEDRLVPEGSWDRSLRLWVQILAWKGWLHAPSRPRPSSRVRIASMEELYEAVAGVEPPEWASSLEDCGDDETCRRAWLSALKWYAGRVLRRESERKEKAAAAGGVAVGTAMAERVESQLEQVSESLVERAERPQQAVSGAAEVERELGLLEKRLVEALLVAPAAREAGRLEELAAGITEAKRLAVQGKVDDALVVLSDVLVSIGRGPDALLVEAAKTLDPEAYEAVATLIENGYAARRALERLIARSSAKLVRRSLKTALAKLIYSATTLA